MVKNKMAFLEGGNWDYGISAGHFRLDCSYWQVLGREIIANYEVDKEGLSERQISIVCGRTERRRIIKRMKGRSK